MLVRLILLLGIAGGLTLFTLSNWLPSLSLVFLGMPTPALPLAMWVLGAIAGGIVTSLLISALFSISNYAAVRQVRSQYRRASRRNGFQPGYPPPSEPEPTSPYTSSYTRSTASSTDASDDSAWRDWEGYEEPADRAQAAAAQNQEDDWGTDTSDDWDDWEDESVKNRPGDRATASANDYPKGGTAPHRSTYEAAQEPKTASRSGSSYSYGYRDPGESGVGRREMVVDADYRVIVPPYQPPEPDPYRPPEETPTENADDWFDDDFETDEERQRRAQQ